MTLRDFAPTNFIAALMMAALPVAAQQYPVVDTGQITCYSASDEIDCSAEGQSFYGQDAQHTGNVPSFTDNGPQGDAIRISNFVRPVRDAEAGGSADASFTYWIEIVANSGGVGNSRWRTDVVARNSSAVDAEITMVLHTEDGDSEMFGVISGSNQAIYPNVVDLFGVTGKGTLEIRSDRPLIATARIYNQTDSGTYGGSLAARTEGSGLTTGEGAWLMGLRQLDGAYRTNLSVTNTADETATVTISLYATDSTLLHAYELTVEPAGVVQDLQPFAARAGQASLGWGFARVAVESGSGIFSSASVIDSRTGDSTMVAMKN